MTFVGFSVQRFGVIPIELLGGGRVVVTERAAEALGLDTQVDRLAQDGQMAQQARPLKAMQVADRSPAAPADRALQGALDGQDVIA